MATVTSEDVQQLRRSLQRLQLAVVALGAGAAALALSAFRTAPPTDQVLRVRGVAVVDSLGRERVLIGAPLARLSRNRRLASAEGLVVLDTAGQLLTAVGYNNPLVLSGDRTGRRIGASTGLTVYDPRTGAERGGMGAFQDGRANACLDYEGDKEAVCLSVAPRDAYAAVLVNGTPGEKAYDRVVMFAAQDGSGSIKVFGGRENQGGVLLRAGKGAPSVALFDSTGKPVPAGTPAP